MAGRCGWTLRTRAPRHGAAVGEGAAATTAGATGTAEAATETAGAATGVTQMGVYVGVFLAPLTTGWLIEHHGYRVMWSTVVVMIVIGSALALWVRDRF